MLFITATWLLHKEFLPAEFCVHYMASGHVREFKTVLPDKVSILSSDLHLLCGWIRTESQTRIWILRQRSWDKWINHIYIIVRYLGGFTFLLLNGFATLFDFDFLKHFNFKSIKSKQLLWVILDLSIDFQSTICNIALWLVRYQYVILTKNAVHLSYSAWTVLQNCLALITQVVHFSVESDTFLLLHTLCLCRHPVTQSAQ